MADPTLADMLLDKASGARRAVRDYGPKGSAAMAERGPFMRDLMPKPAADFAAGALTYGPMALRAPANAAMVVPRGMNPRAFNEADHIGGGPPINGLRPSVANSEILAQIGGRRMQSGETLMDKFDPTFIAARSGGPLFRGIHESANANAPRTSEFTNPAAGRLSQVIDNGGKPPTVELTTPPDLVQRYINALEGRRPRPNLTLVPKD